MACPVCNQTMHSLGECPGLDSIMHDLKKSLEGDETEALIVAAQAVRHWEKNSRHFVCPNCGTVRTVTGDHNDDQPPRIVTMTRVADDTCLNDKDIGGCVRVLYHRWADVRRCIGRERS